jgi:signal transduction histidine kinase
MNPSLGDLGLVASINDLVENIQATRKLKVKFEADETIERTLSEYVCLTIYRIIQEALNNAVKHAQATTVSISIQKRERSIELTVQDNGIGFDPEQIKRGAGLKNIENRVYLANGTLQIRSTPGNGCTLTIHFIL